jgi:hypothetical protein
MNMLYPTMDYAAAVCTDIDFVAEVLTFSLMFFQALFMSSVSFKFSKAANLFEILI